MNFYTSPLLIILLCANGLKLIAMEDAKSFSFREQYSFILQEIANDPDCRHLRAQLETHQNELAQLEQTTLGKPDDLKEILKKTREMSKKELDVESYSNRLFKEEKKIFNKFRHVNPDTLV